MDRAETSTSEIYKRWILKWYKDENGEKVWNVYSKGGKKQGPRKINPDSLEFSSKNAAIHWLETRNKKRNERRAKTPRIKEQVSLPERMASFIDDKQGRNTLAGMMNRYLVEWERIQKNLETYKKHPERSPNTRSASASRFAASKLVNDFLYFAPVYRDPTEDEIKGAKLVIARWWQGKNA